MCSPKFGKTHRCCIHLHSFLIGNRVELREIRHVPRFGGAALLAEAVEVERHHVVEHLAVLARGDAAVDVRIPRVRRTRPIGTYCAIRLTGTPGNSAASRSSTASELRVCAGKIRCRTMTPLCSRPSSPYTFSPVWRTISRSAARAVGGNPARSKGARPARRPRI